MAQAHPTTSVAATKLPKERLAQLDRLATRRGVTRYALIRAVLDDLLDGADEPLTDCERRVIRQRQLDLEARERVAAIDERLRASLFKSLSQAGIRSSGGG